MLLASCKDRQITTYRIPKEAEPTMPPASAAAASTNDLPRGGAAPALPGSGSKATTVTLTWTAPAHWKTKPISAMRRGSFDVPVDGGAVADLSISAFAGAAGGLLGNVNRWRGQVGLAPLPDSQLAANSEIFNSNGLQFTIVDLAGQAGGAPTRLLGAIAEYGGETWFFKLTGPDAGVAREKTAFLEFLHTVKPR